MQTPLLLSLHVVEGVLRQTMLNYGIHFYGSLEEIIKHEFECHFYGQTFRDLTTSPLEDFFNNNRIPTDYRKIIYHELGIEYARLIDRIIPIEDREFYHYQLEWLDNTSVYLHRLEPTLKDTSNSSLEGLLCSY